jgi:hypothetical protein
VFDVNIMFSGDITLFTDLYSIRFGTMLRNGILAEWLLSFT